MLLGRQAVLAVLALVLLLERAAVHDVGLAQLVLVVVGLANFAHYWLNSRGRFSRSREAAQVAVDVAGISVLVWTSGATRSPFVVLYFAEVLSGAVSLSRLGTWLAAGLGMLGFVGAVWAAPSGGEPGLAILDVGALAAIGALTARLVRRLQEALDYRAAAAAHEIKNAVHVVSNLLRPPHRVSSPERPSTASLAAAVAELESLSALANQLYGGTSRQVRRTIGLWRVIEDALTLAQPMLRGAGITARLSGPRAPAWLHGDPDQLRHCFLNLFLNSAQHALAGSDVVVHVRHSWRSARVVIEDRGGARGEPSRRDAGLPGWGLGLDVTRDMLQRNGGRLEVATTDDGAARVTVTLRAWGVPSRLSTLVREDRCEPTREFEARP